MSRFVRTSKYRHVFGTGSKLEDSYANLKLTKNPWDSNYITVNSTFLAVCWSTGGGGAAAVIPLKTQGKLNNVFLVNGHTGPVIDVAFSPFNDNILATASEDTTVKIWQIPSDGLTEDMNKPAQDLRGHARKAGSVNFNPLADNVLATSAIDMKVKVWDIEKGDEICGINEGHTGNIQSVEWNYNGSLITTFSKDKQLRILDPREAKVVSSIEAHGGVKGGRALWMGQKGWIFSAGFNKNSERVFAVWDPSKFTAPICESKIDNSAGIIMPFWDDSSSIIFTAGKGDGMIRYHEVVNDDKILYFLSQYQSSVPQAGAAAMPKNNVDVNKNEICRIYKATPTMVEPISFTVPRKSDAFQEDLFPDVPGNESSLSASEWGSGKNSEPKLVSLAPGFQKKAAPKEFKPEIKEEKGPKTEAEFKLEISNLTSKVGFLEAELIKKEAKIKELKKLLEK